MGGFTASFGHAQWRLPLHFVSLTYAGSAGMGGQKAAVTEISQNSACFAQSAWQILSCPLVSSLDLACISQFTHGFSGVSGVSWGQRQPCAESKRRLRCVKAMRRATFAAEWAGRGRLGRAIY